MLYDKEICTIYKAKNGFVVKCHEPSKKSGKSGAIPAPAEDEVLLAKNSSEVLKIVKNELEGGTNEEQYEKAFKEATAEDAKQTPKKAPPTKK